MPRIALGIEYDGSQFFGWQSQRQQRNIQDTLQFALTKIAQHPVLVNCAGRTDTGVHALEQVVHFDTSAQRDLNAWHRGTNSHLPSDIRVIWAQQVSEDFHARYSALARFYRYVILNRHTPSPLRYHQTTWCARPLDMEKMNQAAQSLVGQHDFSSFRAQSCQSKSPCRYMYFIDVWQQNEQIVIELCANAFLHHMVRNIAGTLMMIGLGKEPVVWTQELLALKNRKFAGITAPSSGLHLAGVYYPNHYGISQNPIFKKLPTNIKRFD